MNYTADEVTRHITKVSKLLRNGCVWFSCHSVPRGKDVGHIKKPDCSS